MPVTDPSGSDATVSGASSSTGSSRSSPASRARRGQASTIRRDLERNRRVERLVERVWPSPGPREALRSLYDSADLLRHCADGILDEDEQTALLRARAASADADPWTLDDHVCLEELRMLISGDTPPRYGHIVVDEAQDLTPMQARSLRRRSAVGGSMTVLGDLAQATGAHIPTNWDLLGALLSDHGDWSVAQLTTSYRVPAEIMEFVAPLAQVVAPALPYPKAVREAGADAVRTVATEPWKLLDDTVAHVARLMGTSDGSTPAPWPSSSPTTRTGWTPSAAGSVRTTPSASGTARPSPCWPQPRSRAWSTTTCWSSSPPRSPIAARGTAPVVRGPHPQHPEPDRSAHRPAAEGAHRFRGRPGTDGARFPAAGQRGRKAAQDRYRCPGRGRGPGPGRSLQGQAVVAGDRPAACPHRPPWVGSPAAGREAGLLGVRQRDDPDGACRRPARPVARFGADGRALRRGTGCSRRTDRERRRRFRRPQPSLRTPGHGQPHPPTGPGRLG